MEARPEGVSIIICSYNGEKRIVETISHIAKQVVHSNISWEVLFVDNASTDNISSVVKNEWASLNVGVELRTFEEKRPGKNYALETGIYNAKYEFMLVCDDDNWLSPQYVSNCYRIMQKQSDVAIVGGQGKAEFETTEPSWFTRYQGTYAVGPQADVTGYISTERNFIYGAGSVIRYTAWKKLQDADFKSLLSGPTGNRLNGGGEDVELCYALLICGYRLWYDSELEFRHFMPAARMTVDYLTKMTKNTANLFDVTFAYDLVLADLRQGDKKAAGFNKRLIGEVLNTVSALLVGVVRLSKDKIIGKNKLGTGKLSIIRCLVKLKICIFERKILKSNYINICKFRDKIVRQ